MADAIAEAMQGDFVTKTAFKSESQGVRAELREIELRLKANIEAMKADLLEWVVGMIGFQPSSCSAPRWRSTAPWRSDSAVPRGRVIVQSTARRVSSVRWHMLPATG